MKYLIIPVKYDNLKRGAFTAAQRFVYEYNDQLDILESSQIKNINHLRSLNSKYKKIIFNTQTPSNYTFPLNIISLQNINFLLYSRKHYSYFEGSTCNNGFYYSLNTKTNHYIPIITDFKIKKKNNNIPCIGFYVRNWLTPDSSIYISELLTSLRQDVNIYTMGQFTSLNCNNKHIKSHSHTYNNKEFFENVTHYIYPMSAKFQDPLPNSLIEAIQSECQIITPYIPGREFKDGIDDVIEVSRYHTSLNFDIELNNSDTIFKSKTFEKFYKNVFDNNFEHLLDRQKYKTFSSWLEGEVL